MERYIQTEIDTYRDTEIDTYREGKRESRNITFGTTKNSDT